MVTWIIVGIIAFLLFVVGAIILFFPSKRIIGAIIVGIAMVLFIATIIGVIVTIKRYQQINENIVSYSASKATNDTGKKEAKEYKPSYSNKDDEIEKKIIAVRVDKKAVYSTLEAKEVPGSVAITLSITNHTKKTLKTYPNQGELTTPKESVNGGDAVLTDFPDSNVAPGKTIKGKLVFPLTKIKKTSDISWITLSWLSYLGDSDKPIQFETDKIKLK